MLEVDEVDYFTQSDQASLEMSIIWAAPASPGFVTVLVLRVEIKHMLIKLMRRPAASLGACCTSVLPNCSVTEICC